MPKPTGRRKAWGPGRPSGGADDLTAAQTANLLGVQADMWTGYAPQRSERRVRPGRRYAALKLAALSEVAWSAREEPAAQ